MGIDILIATFAAYFLFIGLKAFQQINVVRSQYGWVPPISMGMAFCEVYVISRIAEIGFELWLVIAIGLGAACGAVTSMKIQELIRQKYG